LQTLTTSIAIRAVGPRRTNVKRRRSPLRVPGNGVVRRLQCARLKALRLANVASKQTHCGTGSQYPCLARAVRIALGFPAAVTAKSFFHSLCFFDKVSFTCNNIAGYVKPQIHPLRFSRSKTGSLLEGKMQRPQGAEMGIPVSEQVPARRIVRMLASEVPGCEGESGPPVGVIKRAGRPEPSTRVSEVGRPTSKGKHREPDLKSEVQMPRRSLTRVSNRSAVLPWGSESIEARPRIRSEQRPDRGRAPWPYPP